MSGIFMKERYSLTATSRVTRVFCLMSLMIGLHLFTEHGMPLMMGLRVRSRSTQTGIECQLDTLGGDDKSYTEHLVCSGGAAPCALRGALG
jgi:hypothetical protein